MNFNTLNQDLYKKISQMSDKASMSYIKNLLAYSSVLERMFMTEFSAKKTSLGLDKVDNIIFKCSNEFIPKISKFDIDFNNKKIKLIIEDTTIERELVDLNDFIENNLGIKKDSDDYLLALSYLSRIEKFELLQIAFALTN